MEEKFSDFWSMLDSLVESSKIIIDRPKGSAHPRYPSYIYEFDYGYLENTSSPDGSGIDIWVGTADDSSVSAIITSVDLKKRDSEIKILYSCTDDEINYIFNDHNRTDNMKGILNIRNKNK